MRRLVARGRTDRGRIREANEDSLLIGESVFAVADGMGGHLAGEVASATALQPVEVLDGQIFDDAGAAATALRDAVVAANDTVSQLASDHSAYHGMGTTLTAAMLEGRRLHVAHVGDSRGYLLRAGRCSQLTDDHTLVQHLVNEGQITREEAAKHPQRSIITRAIGVSPQVDVDSLTLDLEAGDQILLCSDGLTGVVADREIAEILEGAADPDEAVDQLVARANTAGGPDNITVALLRYEDDEPANGAGPDERPHSQTVTISTRNDSDGDDWAGELGRFGAFGKGGPTTERDEEAGKPGRILGRAVTIVLGLALLAAAVIVGGQFLLSRSYFVALEGEEVAIFQGIDATVGPVDLYRVRERTGVLVDDVQPWYLPTLESGRPATDINDARRIVDGVPLREEGDTESDDGPDAPTDDEPDAT